MNEIEGMPGFIRLVQFNLSSNGSIAAGVVINGVVDLKGLTYTDMPELTAHFADIFNVSNDPVAGLEITRKLDRLRLTPDLPSDDARRFDVYRQLHLKISNISADEIEFADVTLTLTGIALPPSKDLPAVVWPALVAGANVLEAKSLDGVALASTWSLA